MTRIPAPVKRGAALLDERLPGWRTVINVGRLDLSSNCDCVLGEIFGSYDKGLDVLGFDDKQAQRHGFMDGRLSFDRLTQAWREVIR